MKKLLLTVFLVSLIATIAISPAKADPMIVDLNAKTTTSTNPVIVSLEAGTYSVTPIGIDDGGAFNAWTAWYNAEKGWLNSYTLSSDEFSAYTVTSGGRYSTPIIALENAVSTQFTLQSSGNVKFYISDSPYYDNSGGMSLEIAPVPLPGAALLGLMGLSIAGIKLRKKSA